MPSNVRKYDKSCKTIAKDNLIFYQCVICDSSKTLFICQGCKDGGDHQGHPLVETKDVDSVKFCNCGDGSGVYHCLKHKKFEFSNEKPLHLDEVELNKFSKVFSLKTDLAKNISRIYQMRKVDLESNDGQIIVNYFENSKSNEGIAIIKCWSTYRKDQEINFVEKGYDQTRRILLWHGTRKQNLAGILEEGFRKPNSGGVAHGSKFGRGVYFADRVSKSVDYCDTFGTGLLFLCEVALGAMWRTGLPKDYKDVPKEYDSIKGVGKTVPDKRNGKLFGDVIVPSGKTIKNPHPKIKHSQLDCNEFIVFDPERILIRFIVLLKHTSECLIQ